MGMYEQCSVNQSLLGDVLLWADASPIIHLTICSTPPFYLSKNVAIKLLAAGEAARSDRVAGRGNTGVLLIRPGFRLADRLRVLQPPQQQLREGCPARVRLQRPDCDLRLRGHLQHPRLQGLHYGREVHDQVSDVHFYYFYYSSFVFIISFVLF